MLVFFTRLHVFAKQGKFRTSLSQTGAKCFLILHQKGGLVRLAEHILVGPFSALLKICFTLDGVHFRHCSKERLYVGQRPRA